MTSNAVATRRLYAVIMTGTAMTIGWQNAIAMTVALVVNVSIWVCALHAMTLDINKEKRMKNE